MPHPPQPRDTETQDSNLVFLDLSWARLQQVLTSHAVGPANRLAVRHLLRAARANAGHWTEEELCIELMAIIAIALQRPPVRAAQDFDLHGFELLGKGSTMN